MATTYRARAWRYARTIILRRRPDLSTQPAELQRLVRARLNPSLVALARINMRREANAAVSN